MELQQIAESILQASKEHLDRIGAVIPFEHSALDASTLVPMLENVANLKADATRQEKRAVIELISTIEILLNSVGVHALHVHLPDVYTLLVNARMVATNDHLITVSETARLLRGDTSNKNLRWVNGLFARGLLVRYVDPSAPRNAQSRCSYNDVMQLRSAGWF